jgi:transposase
MHNKDQLSLKYSIPGHNTILRWCRKYGKLHYPAQQKIKELEQSLKDEKLKVHAYDKLLEVIKREDGIDLLNKDVAKQFPNLPKSTDEK